ncbi:MAG TPA: DUF364 domain-containing protein [Bacteroidales bacterium]|nr:DUF364 domain-containing protein [Bacteroidales bacterium]
MILDRTYELLRTTYRKDLESLAIADVRVGLFMTAVQLSDGSFGIASSLEDQHPFCSKEDRDFGEFTPLKIKGRKIMDLFNDGKDSNLHSSLKTASLNAFSSKIISSGKYRVIPNCDPIQLLNLTGNMTITIVGAFQSYIRKIAQTGSRLNVLELNEKALQPEQRKFYVPAEKYREVIPESDVLIITGQTLVNNTIDALLSPVKKGTKVIVTGPSGSILPDILFEHGVSMTGASKITNPELAFEIISQGGLGYHLFEYCAQKICILGPDE